MSDMIRVTKANPCVICGHDSWCLIGRSVIICMRVVSPNVKNFKGGEVGYIHPHPDLNKKVVWEPKTNRKTPQVNTTRVLNDWHDHCTDHYIGRLAENLGVSAQSLILLGCCRAPYTGMVWGFPMYDGHHNPIGIRLRSIHGKKWAVQGSQSGIFVPAVKPQPRMFVVEGPTDTAAGLTLGLYTVGRPSCSGGVTHIVDHVKQAKVKEVVIVSDNDEPGIKGAQELQRWLRVPSCLLLLPTKDLREYLRFGDVHTIESIISQLVWHQPKVSYGQEEKTEGR